MYTRDGFVVKTSLFPGNQARLPRFGAAGGNKLVFTVESLQNEHTPRGLQQKHIIKRPPERRVHNRLLLFLRVPQTRPASLKFNPTGRRARMEAIEQKDYKIGEVRDLCSAR